MQLEGCSGNSNSNIAFCSVWRSHVELTRRFEGSLPYMSPEQPGCMDRDPRALKPSIPEVLARIVMKLMAKDSDLTVDDRCTSAEMGVAARRRRLWAAPWACSPP